MDYLSCCSWASVFGLIFGFGIQDLIRLIFGKIRDLTRVVTYGIRARFEILIRQVVGGGDTKAGGIIPQWLERYDRPMGYLFRPDEDVKNLSGGVCNTPVPRRGVWRL